MNETVLELIDKQRFFRSTFFCQELIEKLVIRKLHKQKILVKSINFQA